MRSKTVEVAASIYGDVVSYPRCIVYRSNLALMRDLKYLHPDNRPAAIAALPEELRDLANI